MNKPTIVILEPDLSGEESPKSCQIFFLKYEILLNETSRIVGQVELIPIAERIGAEVANQFP